MKPHYAELDPLGGAVSRALLLNMPVFRPKMVSLLQDSQGVLKTATIRSHFQVISGLVGDSPCFRNIEEDAKYSNNLTRDSPMKPHYAELDPLGGAVSRAYGASESFFGILVSDQRHIHSLKHETADIVPEDRLILKKMQNIVTT
jgi:hypothetical protein